MDIGQSPRGTLRSLANISVPGSIREHVDGNHSVHIKVMDGLEIQGRRHLGMEDGKILNLVPQDFCQAIRL